MTVDQVQLSDIKRAHELIRPHVHRTPLLTSRTLDELVTKAIGSPVPVRLAFKAENVQVVGAFKIRGATNAVLTHLERLKAEHGPDFDSKKLCVVTHSSGNHAAAIARAARSVGASAAIVMPRTSPQVKKDAVAGYGARIVECEPVLAARESAADLLKEELETNGSGTVVRFIHPYDEELVIAGQGTLGLELMDQVRELQVPSGSKLSSAFAPSPDVEDKCSWRSRDEGKEPVVDFVIGPVGGGGMLSGLSTAVKGLDSRVTVIGAEPEKADDAFRSFQTGQLQDAISPPQTICDGLLTALSPRTLSHIRTHVSAIHLASEQSILSALRLVWERMKQIIEPSAAVGLAVAFDNKDFHQQVLRIAGSAKEEVRMVLIWTGGNVELEKIVAALSATASSS